MVNDNKPVEETESNSIRMDECEDLGPSESDNFESDLDDWDADDWESQSSVREIDEADMDRMIEESEQSQDDEYVPTDVDTDGASIYDWHVGSRFGFVERVFVMLSKATKRQEQIVSWLSGLEIAKICWDNYLGEDGGSFDIRSGSIVTFEDGKSAEITSWLEHEGFVDNLLIRDRVVRVQRNGYGELVSIVFADVRVFRAPFIVEGEIRAPNYSPLRSTSKNIDHDDIPF